MRKKKTLEEEINLFLEYWDCDKQVSFMESIIPLFQLYDVDEDDDWVEKEVGPDKEEVRTIRLIRTVYLMSRIAEFQAPKLSMIRMEFKDLYRRLEKEGLGNDN